MSYLAEGLQ